MPSNWWDAFENERFSIELYYDVNNHGSSIHLSGFSHAESVWGLAQILCQKKKTTLEVVSSFLGWTFIYRVARQR